MREAILGAGAALVAMTLIAYFIRLRQPARTMVIWLGDLENELRGYNEICLEKAAREIRLRQLIDKLPADFTYPVFEAMRMGAAAEYVVREEAIRRGLMVDDALKKTVIESAPTTASSESPVKGPMTVWEDGRQRPARLAS